MSKAPRKTRWAVKGIAHTPVIAGDTILYMGGYEAQGQVYLFAVDAKTGERRWASKDPINQFVARDDRVFVLSRPDFYRTTPNSNRQGVLSSMSIKDGKVIWQAPTASLAQDPRLLSIGKYVYYLSDKETIKALDAQSGKLVWGLPELAFPSKSSSSSTAADGDDIYAEMPDHSIVWFNGAEGALKARLMLPSNNRRLVRRLFLERHTLLIPGTDGTLIIADFDKGNVTDSLAVGLFTAPPAVADNVVYFAVVRPDVPQDKAKPSANINPIAAAAKPAQHAGAGQEPKTAEKSQIEQETGPGPMQNKAAAPDMVPYACALDLSTKKWIWLTRLPGQGEDKPLLAGDLLLFSTSSKPSSTQGLLVALERRSGKMVWQTSCGLLSGDPVYKDGVVYVNSKEKLMALDAKTGATLWSVRPEEYGPSGQPVISGNLLYMAAEDSNLYAIKLDTKLK